MSPCLQILQEDMDVSEDEEDMLSPSAGPTKHSAVIIGVGKIFTYEACPQTKCYKAKLVDNRCHICNTEPARPATGITATVILRATHTQQVSTCKIFTDVLQELYRTARPSCYLQGTASHIEDTLMDVLPMPIQYTTNPNTQTPSHPPSPAAQRLPPANV